MISTLVDTNILKDRFQTSYWDVAILAAAKAARCPQLISEDLNHGQNYDGVTVVNPFLGVKTS